MIMLNLTYHQKHTNKQTNFKTYKCLIVRQSYVLNYANF